MWPSKIVGCELLVYMIHRKLHLWSNINHVRQLEISKEVWRKSPIRGLKIKCETVYGKIRKNQIIALCVSSLIMKQ
jgi:hypothetical protein